MPNGEEKDKCCAIKTSMGQG